MMLHDWYRNKRDRHRRETEAKLRAAVAALQVAEEEQRAEAEARRAAERRTTPDSRSSRAIASRPGCLGCLEPPPYPSRREG